MQANKDEVQDILNGLMREEGAIGYVVINFDGIPVKHFPEDPEKMPAVQYASLIADLVVATKKTLGAINVDKDPGAQSFVHLRMRTSQETEMIVTDYTAPGTGNEYILVSIQNCKFRLDDELEEEGEGEKA